MAEHTYLQSRGGTIHIWDGKSPSDRDPWQRAVCGDPGDFNQILNYNGPITCEACQGALGMPVQISLPI